MNSQSRTSEYHNPIPVIELWGNLLVPLQGDISDRQMEQLSSAVLGKIRDREINGLVIDASGVWLVDSHLCASLGRLASAASIMGVRAVMCGLGPDVVMTLQSMGFELRGIRTALSLEDALEDLGVRAIVAPHSNNEDTMEYDDHE